MIDAKNKYYLEDGNIEEVESFINDSSEKGKIIYEVLRVVNKTPLFLKEHIKRMERSFNLIDKSFPYTYDKVVEYVDRLIDANDGVEGNIKLTYNTESEAFKVYYIAHKYPESNLYKTGVKTILYHGERENPNAKIVNTSFREKVTEEMVKAHAYEAILVDNNGNITEGSKSNIFMIKDGKLLTAPAKAVLQGVTRGEIINIAKANGIEVKEVQVKYTDIDNIDAMFISGTSPKVLPICKVDDTQMDINNNVLKLIMSKYDENIKEYISNQNKS